MLQTFLDWLHKIPSEWNFVPIMIATFIFERLASRGLDRIMRSSFVDSSDELTRFRFLKNIQSLVIFIVGFFLAVRGIPAMRTLANSMLATAGLAAVAIGFASQQVLSNIISGIFIIIFRPFRINDRVRIQDKYVGVVEDITMRHTILRDSENRRIVIPNAVINNEILVNSDYVDDRSCKFLEFSLDFNNDIETVKKIMAEETAKHPKYLDVRTQEDRENGKPLVDVRVVRMTDSTIVVRAWAWAKNNGDGFDLMCDLLESIKKRFDKSDVKMAQPPILMPPKK